MKKAISLAFMCGLGVSMLSVPGYSESQDCSPGAKPNPVVNYPVWSERVSLQLDSAGMMVPVAAGGKPFKICGDEKKNTCSLFKEGATITDIETTVITKVTHKINPTCVLFVIAHAGKKYYYYDPTDPNCAHMNG